MKKYIALLMALVITAGALAACTASVPTGSSSQVAASSAVSITQSSVASINNNSYDVYFTLFEDTPDEKNFGLIIPLPEGVYFDNNGILIEERTGIIPYNIYDPDTAQGEIIERTYNAYLGGIEPFLLQADLDFLINDNTVQLLYDEEILTYIISDDTTLPPFTFYMFGNIIVLTDDLIDPGREVFTPIKITSYLLPVYEDYYASICFFRNYNSTEAKEYYEQIVQQITIVEI